MKTRRTKNLWFQFEGVIPRDWTVHRFAEFLQSEGLIQAVERDEWNGTITRYAEAPELYRCSDKERLIREALERLRGAS